jgi:integrative and conjugative element protein (TIGR02256 family)
MKLLLPQRVIKRLKRKLRGRINEIGGVMVGEHVSDDTFRIVDISVQRHGGTVAHFVRDPAHHKAFLADFFTKSGNDYKRFNYIGEWHSHPAFEPMPSGPDFATMYDIVEDQNVGVNFVVLIIARLRSWNWLELSATLFRAGVVPESVDVRVDDAPDPIIKQSRFERFLDFFT